MEGIQSSWSKLDLLWGPGQQAKVSGRVCGWEGEGEMGGERIRLAGDGERALCSGNSKCKGIEASQSSWEEGWTPGMRA